MIKIAAEERFKKYTKKSGKIAKRHNDGAKDYTKMTYDRYNKAIDKDFHTPKI